MVRSQTDGQEADLPTESPPAPQFAELAGTEARLASGDAFLGEAPAPDGYAPVAGQGEVTWDLARITDYARAQIDEGDFVSAPQSAMLADPTSLSPKRAKCSGTTPMILIDLDPSGRLFDAKRIATPSAADRSALKDFRDAGGFVAWISGNSAVAAGSIRAALADTGLDPNGKDDLLLLRYPSDRKQTRREDLAGSSCLLAIAGDERADFDELFDFVANPEAALGLDLLIDDGWFLIPTLHAPSATAIAANKEAQP